MFPEGNIIRNKESKAGEKQKTKLRSKLFSCKYFCQDSSSDLPTISSFCLHYVSVAIIKERVYGLKED